MYFPYIIVGAGITGLTLAERISTILDAKVLVIEKRNHIGGNLYDFYNENSILVHKYGPHIVHTNNIEVWDYLSKFTEWNHVQIKVKAFIDGRHISIPINLTTMKELFGSQFSLDKMKEYFRLCKNDKRINKGGKILISDVGQDLYDKIYKNYILKQWDTEVDNIDISILRRLPIRFNTDDRYFDDRFQGVPKLGYFHLFENMVDNKNIKIILNTDFKEIINDLKFQHMFYTGPIDYYFNYKYGNLQYRGIKFKSETYKCKTFQNHAIISFPNDYNFTRITEYKYLTGQKSDVTTIIKEYPSWNSGEYYPVITPKNKTLYNIYRNNNHLKNITFVGRLAEYKYLNIDEAVERALFKFSDFAEKKKLLP
jgi:UDP-galactopyranose mutase